MSTRNFCKTLENIRGFSLLSWRCVAEDKRCETYSSGLFYWNCREQDDRKYNIDSTNYWVLGVFFCLSIASV